MFQAMRVLENSLVTSANKASGAVRGVCRSAVSLPTSRVVNLPKSLVSPLAQLNCVAWFPLIEQGGAWFMKQCGQWWFLVGLKTRKSKEYLLLSCLNFRALGGVGSPTSFEVHFSDD